MKVFISWSGELSKAIAEQLKKWIPCIIQSIDVFFSPEDIEKGENWDTKISQVLSDCKYGIICLTPQNVSAPWINFEAGAIAKSLDSRVSCLMVNIKPSDIRGPLSRYQATKLDKKDMFQLISEINKATDQALDPQRLTNAFNAMWTQLEQEISSVLKTYSVPQEESSENDPSEEMLQLLRKISSIISSPQDLFPPDYFNSLQYDRQSETSRMNHDMQQELIYSLLEWLDSTCESMVTECASPSGSDIAEKMHLYDIYDLVRRYANRIAPIRTNRNYRTRLHRIEGKVQFLCRNAYQTGLSTP